jgi:hypothetical protein
MRLLTAEWAKNAVRHVPQFQEAWGRMRRKQLHREYEERRERYARIANERGLVYREEDITAAVQARLRKRGYRTAPRALGSVHTFAFIPRISWHAALYPDLRRLGPVSEFDYVKYGYSWTEFWTRSRSAAARRREMNELVLPALREANARRPLDWVFVYATGLEVRRELLERIVDEFGIPVVSMCLDDKQSWTGPDFDGQPLGQVGIASAFDLCWTSARVACDWYLAEGTCPIYLPEGYDETLYHPLDVPRDVPVSFVGGAYGFRPGLIRYLRQHQVPVQVYGYGWKNGGWVDNGVELFNRSVINLGMGGIGYSEGLTNVKTRDFEIPAAGGGLYLTSFNPDLALHFRIGEEIVCYRSRDESLELVRYYLKHPDEAFAIADRARRRCVSEHRWLHRYQRILQVLGILGGDPHGGEPSVLSLAGGP